MTSWSDGNVSGVDSKVRVTRAAAGGGGADRLHVGRDVHDGRLVAGEDLGRWAITLLAVRPRPWPGRKRWPAPGVWPEPLLNRTRGLGVALVLLLTGLAAVVGLAAAAAATSAAAATPGGHDPKSPTPMELAKAMILTGADMPAGWVASSGGERTTHTAPLSAPVAKCLAVSPSVATVKPLKVSSPDFKSPDHSSSVKDSVSVYATAARAQAADKALANPRTPACMGMLGVAPLQTSIEAEAGPHATVDSISISPLPAGAAAPGQTGFTVTVPLTRLGQKMTITSTQIDFEKGRVLQQLTFDGNGEPFTPLEQVHLLLLLTGHP